MVKHFDHRPLNVTCPHDAPASEVVDHHPVISIDLLEVHEVSLVDDHPLIENVVPESRIYLALPELNR